MPTPAKITPNFDYPNNEPADLVAENVKPSEAVAIGAPAGTKEDSDSRGPRLPKSPEPSRETGNTKSIEEQENEDLEVDEGLEGEIPERPSNVPRF